MKLIPNLNRLVVKVRAPEAVSKGGIVLPDAAPSPVWRGEVLANHDNAMLGDQINELRRNGIDVRPSFDAGLVVYFPAHSGFEIGTGDEKVRIIDVSEVLACEGRE